ncbi:response regulator [Hespellia stercorisuis]|uniref:Stage 0 sporulation protein A homolog n=1 Tax=Hespellia stercorisuis DSM 15480 TaxID=1121950 RepID=A0A1M6TU43_9FIRM|nr:transporter substrate-binding domain-containing protein [Hespellia stercorisuis]SHK60535.1 extracellular solute-binding protein, family 3 [Hespellia stercorisuis DSM 15480]
MSLFSISVHAQERETLRVAFYPLEGFFEYDENGDETGYGVDLLNKITEYSGIRFQYVKADSWEDTKKMLLEGRADIRMPATTPQTPSTTLGYSENAIASTSHVLMTLKSREDLFFEDYDTFRQLKIGITHSMHNNLSNGEIHSDIGLEDENLVFYDTVEEEKAALEAGNIDAFISNIMDMDRNMKLLVQLDSVPNYMSMTIGNPNLLVLDNVVSQITMENPYYLQELYLKWFPERSSIPLTKEETAYLQSLGKLTFAFRDGEGYFSMKDEDGKYVGFYPEIAQYLCNQLEVTCEQVSAEDAAELETVIYPEYYFDYEWADKNNISISLPYFTQRYYSVSKRNTTIDKASSRVAIVKNQRTTEDYIRDGYQKEQLVNCTDYADCISAVENGEADIAFVSSYAAEYYLSMYRYADLNYSLTSYTNQISLGVKGDLESVLGTVLDKKLNGLTEEEKERLLTKSTNNHPNQDILQEWVVSRPARAFAIAGGLGAIIVAALLLAAFADRTKKQNIKLQHATDAKSDFLSRMSHDMRTPLNVIIGMNKLAQENDNPPDTDDCLQKIELASEFLLGLINDVLDMERVENGKMELHLTPYSGSEFRNYIETIIGPLCEQKNIEFEYARDKQMEFVVMQDKLKINRIYFNLLSNAVKYTPEGGKIIFSTSVEMTADNKIAMLVKVSDNGIGMSEEFQKHMYDAFSQENQVMASVSQGTGLGLTIVKRMCDLMGMKITVESTLGKGTTFRLYGEYELAEETADADALHAEDARLKDFSVLKGKTILVCEDHMLNQEIVRRLLEKAGCIVDLAEDGRTGVNKFIQTPAETYDAILMDIRMPVMNGLEAAETIRTADKGDAQIIPIIAMTANAYDEDVKKSFDAGMNEHLAKPIDPNSMYAALAKHIRIYREKRTKGAERHKSMTEGTHENERE